MSEALQRRARQVAQRRANLHAAGRLDLDDLNWQSRPYRSSQAYSDSKLANVLFTRELACRLAGTSVTATVIDARRPWTTAWAMTTSMKTRPI